MVKVGNETLSTDGFVAQILTQEGKFMLLFPELYIVGTN
jgi:hypothetical protein